MIKALIIDDEESAINVIKVLAERHIPEITTLQTAIGSQQGLSAMKNFQPDLIFLDIEMPVMNGFELLNQFPEQPFEIIFITAYDHYAIKAIRFSALDYLLKPIDTTELKNAVQRFIEKRKTKTETKSQYKNFIDNLKSQQQKDYKLAVSTTEGMLFYLTDDIIRCEADGNYTRFFLTNKKNIITSKTLKEYDEILTEHNFIRVHRTHLVNKKHIKEYSNQHHLVMSDEAVVEISRRKLEEVKEQLK